MAPIEIIGGNTCISEEGKDLTQETEKEQEVFGTCFVPSEH